MRALHSVLFWACLLVACMAEEEPADPEKILAGIGQICLEAKNPKDLDATIAQLSKLQNGEFPANTLSKIQIAATLVANWQEYLSAQSSGNQIQAAKILENLLRNPTWPGFIPRSEVLSRVADPAVTLFAPVPCNSWSDLPAAIDAVSKNRNPDERSNPDSLQQLQDLQKLSGLLADKKWDVIVDGCAFSQREELYVRRFKQFLLTKAVAGYLNLDAKYQTAPRDNEFPGEYLEKIEDQARQNGDWIALWRITAFERENDYRKTPYQLIELKGLDLFLSAQQLDNPGSADKAAIRYRSALVLPLSEPLIDAISQKIQVFQKTYPDQMVQARGRTPVTASLERTALQPSPDPDTMPKSQNGRAAGLWTRY